MVHWSPYLHGCKMADGTMTNRNLRDKTQTRTFKARPTLEIKRKDDNKSFWAAERLNIEGQEQHQNSKNRTSTKMLATRLKSKIFKNNIKPETLCTKPQMKFYSEEKTGNTKCKIRSQGFSDKNKPKALEAPPNPKSYVEDQATKLSKRGQNQNYSMRDKT